MWWGTQLQPELEWGLDKGLKLIENDPNTKDEFQYKKDWAYN